VGVVHGLGGAVDHVPLVAQEMDLTTAIRRRPGRIAVAVLAALGTLGLGLLLKLPASALETVTAVQRDLAGLDYLPAAGVDGANGPQTRAAIRAFEHDNGLTADGVDDPRTELALHNKVAEVQRVANAPADGQYGPVTSAAVRVWQNRRGLAVDGVAGPDTMAGMGVDRTVWMIADRKMAQHGWPVAAQHGCLVTLWTHESDWQVYATNPSSGAYGIAQAWPARKYGATALDWRTSAATQIQWGLDYIKSRYGTPCAAWTFWQARNPHWY